MEIVDDPHSVKFASAECFEAGDHPLLRSFSWKAGATPKEMAEFKAEDVTLVRIRYRAKNTHGALQLFDVLCVVTCRGPQGAWEVLSCEPNDSGDNWRETFLTRVGFVYQLIGGMAPRHKSAQRKARAYSEERLVNGEQSANKRQLQLIGALWTAECDLSGVRCKLCIKFGKDGTFEHWREDLAGNVGLRVQGHYTLADDRIMSFYNPYGSLLESGEVIWVDVATFIYTVLENHADASWEGVRLTFNARPLR
jgi:hypothetical protein